jgi:hypothetical protein
MSSRLSLLWIIAAMLGLLACAGDTGKQGDIGTQGEIGERGERGEPGEQGPASAMGERGVQGEMGDRGVRGPKGLDGAQGADGTEGTTGVNGANGSDGSDGLSGRTRAALVPLSTYATGAFDEGASETLGFHAASGKLFVTNAQTANVEVMQLDASGKLQSLGTTLEPTTDIGGGFVAGGVNSVSVYGDLVAMTVDADPIDAPGRVAFYDAVSHAFLNAVTVGSLPDMVTFTPNGQLVLVANEGEQIRDDDLNILSDAEGSVSIIDVSGGAASATVTQIGFEGFDAQLERLRGRGVRLVEDDVSADLEPEYVAVTPDSSLAFVTLQENNAFAVIDLATKTVVDILPLGLKEWGRGLPSLTSYEFDTDALPVLGTLTGPSAQELKLGGFSGLWYAGEAGGTQHFFTIPDRGPNPEPTDLGGTLAVASRPHPLCAGGTPSNLCPGYQAKIYPFELDEDAGTVALGTPIPLTRKDGVTPITGLPNHAALDPAEIPIDAFGNPLTHDPMGGDFEGIVQATDGSFWLVDEYRPAIYHFGDDGVMIERYVPMGTGAAAGGSAGDFGAETLPADYMKRRANRGFEGVALDAANEVLYALIQTPLANPNTAASNASDIIRILAVDISTGNEGAVVAEHGYALEKPARNRSAVDKIGDATYLGNGKLLVVERDSSFEADGKKLVFEVDLTHATNLVGLALPNNAKTLEQHTVDELVAGGVNLAHKRKLFNLPSLGYLAGDKTEGIAMLDDGRIAVINDNDFAMAVAQIPGNGDVVITSPYPPITLGVVAFDGANGLDASDRDGMISIQQWPALGMYMPDSVKAFNVSGRDYFITANEGDSRDYDESRVRSETLDPIAFPTGSTIRDNTLLGRLKCSAYDGDIDGDGDLDEIHSYGARSVTIWDSYGNRVSDTGDLFERVTARALPWDFNSDNTENFSFDTRSDDKGPEPEGVVVGHVNGGFYAFVGLERTGGIMVLDVTVPEAPVFVDYVTTRDFVGNPEYGVAGDLAPEELLFIAAEQSPTGNALLVVAHEVSGTTTVFDVEL